MRLMLLAMLLAGCGASGRQFGHDFLTAAGEAQPSGRRASWTCANGGPCSANEPVCRTVCGGRDAYGQRNCQTVCR